MKWLISRWLARCGLFLVFLAACQSPNNSLEGNEAAPPTRLRLVTPFKINSLAPTDPRAYFLPEFGVAELPLGLDREGRLQPWLLASFAQVDARNWRLVLRPGVKFQNGRLLDATAMAAAMNRQLQQSASARAALPGAQISVAGELHLTLTTAQPDASVPHALADELVFPIYDAAAVAAAGADTAQLISSGCFTGPYRVAHLDEREMRLTRFNEYWQGQPPLTEVALRFVSDSQARILAVQNDEADVALYPPAEARRILTGRSDAFFVTSRQSAGGPRIMLNVRRAPFDEVAVRRAFSLSVDYGTLAAEIMEGIGDRAMGFYPPLWSWAVANLKTDAIEAQRLLEEAGWRMGSEGARVKNGQPLALTLLIYPQQPDFTALATALQAQLRETGFRVEIRQVEDINAAMRNQTDWHAAFNSPGLVSTGGAPEPFLREPLTSNGERNFGGVSDAELDRLVNELSRTFDAQRRHELLARIQQIVMVEKVYEVRPVFLRARAVVGKRWRNYQPSPQLHHVTFTTKAQ